MKLNKAFRFRIYPNEEQKILINKTFGCCRFIYNKMLSDKILFYQQTKQSLKNTPAQYKQEFEFLKEVDCQALCYEQMNLQSAYNNFFRDPKIGFPKFKRKKFGKRAYTTNCIFITNNKIKLGKLGVIICKFHRHIPMGHIIKSATISQKSSGKYYISILTEYSYEIPNKQLDKNKSLGLDYSSKNFYIDNQNMKALKEHYYRQSENKLAREQRKLSLMKYGSNNYFKQKAKLGKVYELIENQRKDFIERKSTELARSYDYICIEDINMKNMSQTLRLGKSTMDNGFGMFRVRLQQKMELLGKKLIKIDKWFPSSKTCRFCGCINKNLKLKDREWDCECGAHLLRDENAAINILKEGLKLV